MDTVERPSNASKSINLKILGVCSVLLLGVCVYNTMGGGVTLPHAHGRSSRVREAALPLQKRPRKSRFAGPEDPDNPEVVVAVQTPLAATQAAVPVQRTPTTSTPVPAAATSAAKQPFAEKVDSDATALSSVSGSAMAGLSCHAHEGYDLAGDAAYVWGLAFNVASAAECCAACAAQRTVCGQANSRGKPFWRASRRERTQGRCSGAPGVCNSWVFCPGSDDTPGADDRCFSYTIHNHSKGECWLKHEANLSYPIAAGPTLPLRMRRAPRKDWPWAVATNVWPWDVPEKIHWQAGLLAERSAPVWKGTRKPDWHHKFCNGRHGPC